MKYRHKNPPWKGYCKHNIKKKDQLGPIATSSDRLGVVFCMILPFIIPTISSWDISKPFLHHQEVIFMTHYPLLKVAIPNGGLFHLQHQSTVQNTSTKEINKMETNNECITKLYKNNMSKHNV